MKRKLQVFVSSTFTDLIEERQAAVSAILKAGHIPAGMELFTAADRSQMDIIKNWIDESDVYMLILGGRYGSIEPTSGKSYTELEYDYAVEKGKALFAVVIKEEALELKVKENGTDFIELNEPKSLAQFKSKVLSNISSFFEDVKDIRLCVHESLTDFNSNRSLKGWISADEIIDSRELADEIAKLSEENRELKEEIQTLNQKLQSKNATPPKSNSLKEIFDTLKSKKITVPPNASGEKEAIELDLASILFGTRNHIINGITNASTVSDGEVFLYQHVCPILKIYGLVENEKVAGVRYRRYGITEKGLDLLAYMDKEKNDK